MEENDGNFCPIFPASESSVVELDHGSGGLLSRRLLAEWILPRLAGVGAQADHDARSFDLPHGRLALTTDGFVVSPRFFPGGDLGRLAVYGTANDLVMALARPRALSLALILEEGLPLEELGRVLDGVAAAAREVGVEVLTGDTKVVERGAGDGIYVTTAGVGERAPGSPPGPHRIRPGDAILLSGDVARHGLAVLTVREGLGFEGLPESDCAYLGPAVEALVEAGIEVHCLRDTTRGGLAAALHELATAAGLAFEIWQGAVAVHPAVAAACELLGLDPLHVACEGRFLAVVPAPQAERALGALRAVPVSSGAVQVGCVREGDGVTLVTASGGRRPLRPPTGRPLPRIC
ncbi:MAG: hydrogenase expression/formation protein HypE [Porticoccaceae bacterium]|nr:MAG: hydrogenase expression/formation protein HypE [Porticoccaceae bacterium]